MNQPSPDYWIISSRRCAQSGIPRCNVTQLDYFRVTAAGRPTASNFAEYKRQLDPKAPMCMVVHGSYSSWQSLVDESAIANRWLRTTAGNRPLRVAFYTWPSEAITTILPAIDVAILGRRASFNGFYLSQLIQQTPDGSQISFFAHSHGSRVVASALHLLDGGQLQSYQLRVPGRGNRSLRPIFVAAAIDHHWLNPGERFGRALNQIDNGLVFYNQNDLALTIYPLRRLFSHRPLGLVGFDRKDRRLQNRRMSKLAEVDVTPLVETGHFWVHYFNQPRIAAAMRPYLFFDQNSAKKRTPTGRTVPGGNANRKANDRVIWHSSARAKPSSIDGR
ncbi:MAG: alpha/beta hydrolase [Planctomycetaceae bacterium]|nr:alpha/beta hydrolase [Planctomycetaceae bacterium]MBT6155138.1 alpha/beta hydrolase [Planctomycetaceae bacterium]MBT6483346.1 alpha/beta hydrolase [Planctomycetaceae bacterium]MBT6493859.1 alpha/beta hydrolase [Planctomycetaceae bacterium]